jgi:hypothetical protein
VLPWCRGPTCIDAVRCTFISLGREGQERCQTKRVTLYDRSICAKSSIGATNADDVVMQFHTDGVSQQPTVWNMTGMFCDWESAQVCARRFALHSRHERPFAKLGAPLRGCKKVPSASPGGIRSDVGRVFSGTRSIASFSTEHDAGADGILHERLGALLIDGIGRPVAGAVGGGNDGRLQRH